MLSKDNRQQFISMFWFVTKWWTDFSFFHFKPFVTWHFTRYRTPTHPSRTSTIILAGRLLNGLFLPALYSHCSPGKHAFVEKHYSILPTINHVSYSLIGTMFPLPRILYAMSCDGLLFSMFSDIHPKYQTPLLATLLSGLLAGKHYINYYCAIYYDRQRWES